MEEFNGITPTGTTLPTKTDKKEVNQKIVWRNVILFAYLHLAALYGILLIFTSAKIATIIYGLFINLKYLLFNSYLIFFFF